MHHVSAQGVDERVINVQYYYYYWGTLIDVSSPALARSCDFGSNPLHVCSVLRVLVGHSRRALVSEKGQWVTFWSASAWCRPLYSQTVRVCHSLAQQPFNP